MPFNNYSKDGGRAKGAARQRMDIFAKRRLAPEGLRWENIDNHVLRTALGVAVAHGTSIQFSPAAGGFGVTIKLYAGDDWDTVFCASAEQINEALELIANKLGGTAEDFWQLYRRKGEPERKPETTS